jgi:hypothetical protein
MKQGWITNEWEAKEHFVDDKLHSIDDEPSVIEPNGYKSWHKEGKTHRETGPARIRISGDKEYYFEGKHYPNIQSDLEWLLKVEELKKK